MESTRSHGKSPRAIVACTKCRIRKVRCDVSRRGHPCINCELDHEECVVIPRSRMRRLNLGATITGRAEPQGCERTSPERNNSERTATTTDALSVEDSKNRLVDIPFQAYRFVQHDFLPRLSEDEIRYLDSQLCFRLPTRASWDRMIHAYFRYINPLFPVMNEQRFWEESRDDSPPRLSLFVIHAILFAACPFADRNAITGCGFSNCRDARATFYRRAKVRFEHNLCLVQMPFRPHTYFLRSCTD